MHHAICTVTTTSLLDLLHIFFRNCYELGLLTCANTSVQVGFNREPREMKFLCCRICRHLLIQAQNELAIRLQDVVVLPSHSQVWSRGLRQLPRHIRRRNHRHEQTVRVLSLRVLSLILIVRFSMRLPFRTNPNIMKPFLDLSSEEHEISFVTKVAYSETAAWPVYRSSKNWIISNSLQTTQPQFYDTCAQPNRRIPFQTKKTIHVLWAEPCLFAHRRRLNLRPHSGNIAPKGGHCS